MNRRDALYVVLAFVLGATTVLVAKTKVVFDPNAYYAGKDSWQRIGIGRVAYAYGGVQPF